MCIAILNKNGQLPYSHLENSWKNNNEGGGLLWVQDGALKTYKTYDFKEFTDMYYSIRTNANIGNIVLHFRIATSGFKNPINLHPFLVNDDLGFVHNGIISGLGNADHSDTYQFNELLQKLPQDFITNESIMHFIQEYISSSKLLFLDSDDRYFIVNERFGHWDTTNDNWYSNDSYKQYNDWYYFGNQKISKTHSHQYPKPLSKNQKKRNAKKNRKYLTENFLNVTEFNIDWLEDILECSIDEEQFIELLDMYYEETWEGDLSKLIEYITEDKVKQRERDANDFDSAFFSQDGLTKHKNLDFYDNSDYHSQYFY